MLCAFSRRALICKRVNCFVDNNRSSIIPSKTSDTINFLNTARWHVSGVINPLVIAMSI